MIKIERELQKREQHNKKDERKSNFLPTIHEKKGAVEASRVNDKNIEKIMNSSYSSVQFNGLKLPKI